MTDKMRKQCYVGTVCIAVVFSADFTGVMVLFFALRHQKNAPCSLPRESEMNRLRFQKPLFGVALGQ